jgi:cell division protein FtsI (penicillin-binding protein 3)
MGKKGTRRIRPEWGRRTGREGPGYQRRENGGRVVYLSGERRRPIKTPRQANRTAPEGRMVGRGRLQVAVVVVAVVGLILSGRAAQLSVADGERYQAIAAEQRVESGQGATQGRGSIISADGRELATNVEADGVVATPYQIKEPAAVAASLEEIIGAETGLDADEIEEKLTARDGDGDLTGYSFLGTVGSEAAEEVRELGVEGINLTPGSERVYPDGTLAGQLTGYLGDYGRAFGGVEARYDDALKAGNDVELTLDTAVQERLEGAIASAADEYRARSAMGIVMRVEDGAVVGLANYPDYDNNRFGQASAELQRDRVLTDPYEPGSTFKPFTVAAALEEGTLAPDSTFTVPDSIQVADRVIHDSEPHVTEVMHPEDILARSSNVGTIQIAQQLGGKRLDGYIREFGFGEPTGIDLWGEDPGAVPAFENWSGSSIGNIPMGQGLTVTPLQLAAGYSTLANGGHRVTPYVAKTAAPDDTGPRVISQETSDIVRGMLQSVVESGTGHYAGVKGYTVAGKTGTSQKVDPTTGTYGDKYTASFVGFAPATDPEYVTLIVVDEPEESIWGEQVAAPAFRKVMSFTLSYFNVPPDDANGEAR